MAVLSLFASLLFIIPGYMICPLSQLSQHLHLEVQMESQTNKSSHIGVSPKQAVDHILMGNASPTPHIIMTGLFGAGKSTISQYLKTMNNEQTVEMQKSEEKLLDVFRFETMEFKVWDVGLSLRNHGRYTWIPYYQNCQAIVFVLDAADPAQLTKGVDENIDISAQEELALLLDRPELARIPVLVFANKQDLPDAISVEEISVLLELENMNMKNREWHIEGSVATTQQGLKEGISSLKSRLHINT
jgi:signal recognition particle receptor subunit beta